MIAGGVNADASSLTKTLEFEHCIMVSDADELRLLGIQDDCNGSMYTLAAVQW